MSPELWNALGWLLLAGIAFWAGYERGRLVEFRRGLEAQLDELSKKLGAEQAHHARLLGHARDEANTAGRPATPFVTKPTVSQALSCTPTTRYTETSTVITYPQRRPAKTRGGKRKAGK